VKRDIARRSLQTRHPAVLADEGRSAALTEVGGPDRERKTRRSCCRWRYAGIRSRDFVVYDCLDARQPRGAECLSAVRRGDTGEPGSLLPSRGGLFGVAGRWDAAFVQVSSCWLTNHGYRIVCTDYGIQNTVLWKPTDLELKTLEWNCGS
jgi:hypothetical protein